MEEKCITIKELNNIHISRWTREEHLFPNNNNNNKKQFGKLAKWVGEGERDREEKGREKGVRGEGGIDERSKPREGSK